MIERAIEHSYKLFMVDKKKAVTYLNRSSTTESSISMRKGNWSIGYILIVIEETPRDSKDRYFTVTDYDGYMKSINTECLLLD